MKRGALVREDGSIAVPLAWRADRAWTRLRGLLLRKPLRRDGAEALLITPCGSVHTLGMRYPLDLVFLDRDSRVCGWKTDLAPWRMAACRRAKTTVELHAGALAGLRPRLGELWQWQPLAA